MAGLNRLVAIAPAPAAPGNTHPEPSFMSYSCQNCAKRKVRCDKVLPICSSCSKSKLACFYQAPPPRRKRKASEDLSDKVARYEQILREHDLLPKGDGTYPSALNESSVPTPAQSNTSADDFKGRLMQRNGVTRYVTTSPWHILGDEDFQYLSDDEDEVEDFNPHADLSQDPLTGAFMGSYQSLLPYHPSAGEALVMWQAHAENVEPLCKILHIPSVGEMINRLSLVPETASKPDECLLFAIYHFAVNSMSDEQCIASLNASRDALIERYRFAARQAFVNANFLRMEDSTILQAFVLFLLACRHFYHPSTYWILTGVAVRMAQRLGLHRDGEEMGLAPFEVEMKRRLFFQVLPLDGVASRISGTGMMLRPDMWTTRQPSNINDTQIWPSMTEKPQAQEGATDMIFCATRATMGMSLVRIGLPLNNTDAFQPGDFQVQEMDKRINEIEAEMEANYIRYCDVINPLHFLSMGFARSGITAMRIRVRLPKARRKTLTKEEGRELFQLCLKVIDTDTAVYEHGGLTKFRWWLGPFFAWGSWEALVFLLSALRDRGFTSRPETDLAWSKIEKLYKNHKDFMESKRAFQIAICRITLAAWDDNPPSTAIPPPEFISALRSSRRSIRSGAQHDNAAQAVKPDIMTPPALTVDDDLFNGFQEDLQINAAQDFSLNDTDWMYWDRLVQDYEAQQY